ncbi:MAG: hypothetical protein ACE5R6_21885, partial [Candidatus Heimdallarchaeota archaeon]
MKKPNNDNIIKKGLNIFFWILILFLLVTTNYQTQNMFQPVEDISIAHERIDYRSHPYQNIFRKAKTVQSGSGSSFAVQETFNGYNSSVLGNTTNSFNNPSNRTSDLDITNPTNYQKQSGTITVANITAENDWREIESKAELPIVMLGGATSNPNTTAMEFNIT